MIRTYAPFTLAIVVAACSIARAQDSALWIHAKARPVEGLPLGPFVHLNSGAVMTVDGADALVSDDGGATWDRRPIFADPDKYKVRPEAVMLRTRAGTIVLAFANDVERVWTWDKEAGDAPGAVLPTYVVVSRDDGATWERPVKLHDEWTGAIRGIIQTESGAVVFTSMMILHDPGRHATITYRSDDEGGTWRRSNLIDLGGAGHHDGGIEATLVERRDGTLWMLIRTTLDYFWEAISTDDGRTWRIIRPTDIDASTAPPALARLASGRLMMAWNRLYPEGVTEYERRGGDNQWSAVPAVNHREELSVAFSDDDGATWSRSVVVARNPGKRLSYPFIFEYAPGKVWLTAWQGELRLALDETDFIGGE